MNSTIIRLVKFVDIFGNVEWVTTDMANEKMIIEQGLYNQWKDVDFLKTPLTAPYIDDESIH